MIILKSQSQIWASLFSLGFIVENFLFNKNIVQSLYLSFLISVCFIAWTLFNNKEAFFEILFQKKSLFIVALLFFSIALSVFRFHELIISDSGPFFRQSASLIIGLITFLGFILYLKSFDIRDFFKACFYVSFLPLIVGLLQFITGLVSGTYYRVSSIFSEPGYFGDYIAWIALPTLVYTFIVKAKSGSKNYILEIAYAVLLLINIITPQSMLLFMKLSIVVALTLFFAKISRVYKFRLIYSVIIALGITITFSRSYTSMKFESAFNALSIDNMIYNDISFVDRLMPAPSVAKNFFDHRVMLGSGLGADWYQGPFPMGDRAFKLIATSKSTKSIMNALLPKSILYFGVLFLLPIFIFIFTALKNVDAFTKIFTLAIILSSLFSMATFTMPYIWFWLATLSKNKEFNLNNAIFVPL